MDDSFFTENIYENLFNLKNFIHQNNNFADFKVKYNYSKINGNQKLIYVLTKNNFTINYTNSKIHGFTKIFKFNIIKDNIYPLYNNILKCIKYSEDNQDNFNNIVSNYNCKNKSVIFSFKNYTTVCEFSKTNCMNESINENDIQLFKIFNNIKSPYFRYGDLIIAKLTPDYNGNNILLKSFGINNIFQKTVIVNNDLNDVRTFILLKYLNLIPNYKSKLLKKIIETLGE